MLRELKKRTLIELDGADGSHEEDDSIEKAQEEEIRIQGR